MSHRQTRSLYPPYSPLAPSFDYLAVWSPRLSNWARVNAGELRNLGYVLPCYAHREEAEGGDDLDADKVEKLISEMRQAGGWEAHEAVIKLFYMGNERTWEQVAQIMRKSHPKAFADARQVHSVPADACRHLADRMCARLDVLDRAY